MVNINITGANDNSKEIHVNGLERGKTRVTKSQLVLVLYLIFSDGCTSFLDQSQSVVKQNQCNPGLLSTVDLNLLYYFITAIALCISLYEQKRCKISVMLPASNPHLKI